jgi:hypothetical protein
MRAHEDAATGGGAPRVFTGAVGGRVASTSGSSSTVDGTQTNVSLTPGIDVFLFEHVSLGGALAFGYAGAGSTKRTTYGLGPRIGAAIPLSRSFSLYPRVLVGYTHVISQARAAAGNPRYVGDLNATSTSSGDIFTLGAHVPVLLHVAPHFFLGFGPTVVQELSRQFGNDTGNLGRRLGAELEIGGWL